MNGRMSDQFVIMDLNYTTIFMKTITDPCSKQSAIIIRFRFNRNVRLFFVTIVFVNFIQMLFLLFGLNILFLRITKQQRKLKSVLIMQPRASPFYTTPISVMHSKQKTKFLELKHRYILSQTHSKAGGMEKLLVNFTDCRFKDVATRCRLAILHFANFSAPARHL